MYVNFDAKEISKGTLITEEQAKKLRKEFGGTLCGRCNLYGMDIDGIAKTKTKYKSELMNMDGVYWCPPHFQEVMNDVKLMMGEERFNKAIGKA